MDSDTKKALEDYYKLKGEYDTKIQAQRKKIRNDKSLSKQERRRKMLELVPKCINCGKRGGTKFTINGSILRCVCGNTEEPCSLNIEINRGMFENLSNTYNLFMEDREDVKEDIIRTRLDLLFNYKNEEETITKFNELTEEHKIIEQGLMDIQEQFDNIILGKRNAEAIIESRQNLYSFKRKLADLAKQYADSGDEMLIQEMIDLYISDIRPEVEKLRNFKYSLSTIECSDGGEYMGTCDDDERILVQEPYTAQEVQISPSEEPVVISNSK